MSSWQSNCIQTYIYLFAHFAFAFRVSFLFLLSFFFGLRKTKIAFPYFDSLAICNCSSLIRLLEHQTAHFYDSFWFNMVFSTNPNPFPSFSKTRPTARKADRLWCSKIAREESRCFEPSRPRLQNKMPFFSCGWSFFSVCFRVRRFDWEAKLRSHLAYLQYFYMDLPSQILHVYGVAILISKRPQVHMYLHQYGSSWQLHMIGWQHKMWVAQQSASNSSGQKIIATKSGYNNLNLYLSLFYFGFIYWIYSIQFHMHFVFVFIKS